MALATVRFKSHVLDRQVTYSALLPEDQPGPHPVVLQLHGYSDDHLHWLLYSRLADHVLPYNIIVVMPAGENSFYINAPSNSRRPHGATHLNMLPYEDFLMQDLWEHVTRTFQTRRGRWAIGGLSMGGYGAMRLGCKYPDRFASIWAHSGVYDLGPSKKSAFGLEDASVYTHVNRLAESGHRIKISFDCGIDDELIDHSRRLHRHMDKLGLPHHYAEHPGGHTWEYWDQHVQEALKQHAEVFAAEGLRA